MFGQMPDFSNSFDMLRKMWEQSAMPAGLMPGMSGFGTPPVSLDELEKRIQDLKAVESWLQLNVNLLRSTIQGLEVQRATLVALQTFGATLSPEAMQATMARMAERQGGAAEPSQPSRPPEGAPAAPKQAPQEPMPEPASEPAADAASAETADAAAAGKTPDNVADNAALWWNLLQQQFNQIASSAAAATMPPFGGVAAGSGYEVGRRGAAPRKATTREGAQQFAGAAPAPPTSTAKPAKKSTTKPTAKSSLKSAARPSPDTSSTKRAVKRPPA